MKFKITIALLALISQNFLIDTCGVAAISFKSDSAFSLQHRESNRIIKTTENILSGNKTGLVSASLAGVDAAAIPITMYSSTPVFLAGSNNYQVTFGFGLGANLSGAHLERKFSGMTCGQDGAVAINLCVTLNYGVLSDGTFYFANNQSDSIKGTLLDPHSATLSSEILTTGGFGLICNGVGFLSDSETWTIASPGSGVSYSRQPRWAGNHYRIASGLSNLQSVQGQLNWYYRGNPEVFKMNYVIPDSEPSWPSGGCTN